MKPKKSIFIAQEIDLELRLDKVLVNHFPDYSRHFLQKLLEEKHILVNQKPVKAGYKLKFGDKVEITFPPLQSLKLEPKNIPLEIIFENKDLLIINKQPGLVAHPGAGDSHIDDSLVNAVLYHCKGELSGIGGVQRPGIVHRLDKDTSGLLIIAKNDQAHQDLARQLQQHRIEKTYLALLSGHLKPAKGAIDAPIGRSSLDRKKMAVQTSKSKEALTRYRVLEYFKKPISTTLLEAQLITGRTHQLRVHFASIDYPIVGDPLYGREKVNKFFEEQFGLTRQFLHAQKIAFMLPGIRKKVAFEALLPKDLKAVIKGLKN